MPSSQRSQRMWSGPGNLLNSIRRQDNMCRKRTDEEQAKLDFSAQLGQQVAACAAQKVERSPENAQVVETVAAKTEPAERPRDPRVLQDNQKKEDLVSEMSAHLAKGDPQTKRGSTADAPWAPRGKRFH
eukprot:2521642-Prymnesium_polylepis.1